MKGVEEQVVVEDIKDPEEDPDEISSTSEDVAQADKEEEQLEEEEQACQE